jgi:general secretion pathway protein L
VAPKRLQDALRGALEDQLLEDNSSTHLAVSQQGVQADGPTWVAALHRPWIEQTLAHLHEQGLQADALVSLSEPGPQWQAHACIDAQGQAVAVVSGPQGVAMCPLGWSGWRARQPHPRGARTRDESHDGLGHATPALRWTAEPNAAQALAEQGQADARLWEFSQRAMHAATTGTNLLQFDLRPQRQGTRALWAAWTAFKGPRYRAVHIGLLALVLVQALGLNLSAWQAQSEVQALQQRHAQLLRDAFPSIQVVVDPVLQAERELQTMRQAAGEPGPQDLETGLNLVARAWAAQALPLQAIRWDAQGLSLVAAQWPTDTVQRLRELAAGLGWQTQMEAGALRLIPPGVTPR